MEFLCVEAVNALPMICKYLFLCGERFKVEESEMKDLLLSRKMFEPLDNNTKEI